MPEAKDSCVKPAKGPIGPPETQIPASTPTVKEEPKMPARVGKPGPDLVGKVWTVWKPEMAY